MARADNGGSSSKYCKKGHSADNCDCASSTTTTISTTTTTSAPSVPTPSS